LHFEGRHASIARYYPEGTILSSGLSKWCGAGGWRLGTFSFPDELDWLAEALATVASETYTSVSAPIQFAAIRALAPCGEIDDYLNHTRRILAAVAKRVCPILNRAGVRAHPPVGGFYVYLDFLPVAERLGRSGIQDGRTLCDRLLEETGVALLPGAAFGRRRSDLTARLAFVDFNGEAALRASRSLGPVNQPLPDDFADRHCASVVSGVRRIAEWASET
jgi:aspartate aminotransferase